MFEAKWGVHKAGEGRSTWASSTGKTLTILISGRFTNSFRDEDQTIVVQMSRPGDFILFGPDTEHTWRALEDSVVLTFRWPSIPLAALNFSNINQWPFMHRRFTQVE